ncbi:MAG: hypothetical protein IKE17_08060 [Clostridia bacterium]|nr:hypothetical protein [Clostridia bacterium]
MMRTALVVMADILVLVVALLAVTEFHALRRFNTFTVPFTDCLIACGAIQPENRQRVLREDRVVHAVGIALPVVIWLMLSKFFAGVSGLIAFPVGVIALLALLRPGMREDAENREQYYRVHRKYIDDIRYHEYLSRTAEH